MCTWTTQDRRSFLYSISNNLFPATLGVPPTAEHSNESAKDLGIRLSGVRIKSMSNPAVIWMHITTYSHTGDKAVPLQVRLRAAVEDFISEGAAPAERMIRDLVDCEHAYINTDHPQFIGGNRALSQVCSLASSMTSEAVCSDAHHATVALMLHQRC